MRAIRSVCCVSALLAALIGVVSFGAPRVAATTGPTYTLSPARYRIGHDVAVLYAGQYELRSVASGARLRSGLMAIEINQIGYLAGVATFGGYNARGFRTTWVATLYDFHLTGRGIVIINLFGPLGNRLLGRLFVHRTKQGDLVGEIALPSTRYAISWHKNVSL